MAAWQRHVRQENVRHLRAPASRLFSVRAAAAAAAAVD